MFAAFLVAVLAPPADAGASIRNNGGRAAPIKAGTEFRVSGRGESLFTGEVWVDRFVVERGARLKVQATAVSGSAPAPGVLMVHARTFDVQGEVELAPGGWGQFDVERRVSLNGRLVAQENARFRVNGCPVATWTLGPRFSYRGAQAFEIWGAPSDIVERRLKDVQKNHMTCEQVMPGRTPVPPGMKGRVRVDRSEFHAGRVEQGKEVEHTFILRNTGKETLWVGNVKTS